MTKSAHGLSSQHQNCISRTSENIKRSEVLAISQKSTQNWLGTLCMPQVPIYVEMLSNKLTANCRCSDIYEEHHREAYWRTYVSVLGVGFKCTTSKAQSQSSIKKKRKKKTPNHKYTSVLHNEQGSSKPSSSCETMQSEPVAHTGQI